jgi:glutamate racemase
MGPEVTLVSSAEETAQDVFRQLVARGLQRIPGGPPPRHRFYSSGDKRTFYHLARRFLGPEAPYWDPAATLTGEIRAVRL